jgi:cardiolipin synthase
VIENPRWREGHRVELLINGEEYYPRVFAAMQQAQREILIETFILFDDQVGQELQGILIAAARRGVRVEVSVDGYGSPDLSPEFVGAMTEAGVRLHVYDPRPRLLGVRTNVFRRMHRKLVVVDGRIAYCGGINFAFDHLRAYGPLAKQDYAVEVEGPVVDDIRLFMLREVGLEPRPARNWRWWRRTLERAEAPQGKAGPARVAFVTRDNDRHRRDVESLYRQAIREARREIQIVNAYFFPNYRLLKSLKGAASRGVKVRLIMQGNPDIAWVRWATVTLYDYLLRGGVRIFEYCERPMHGKVALIDDDWSTVGSSNLDPLSLFLNMEANVFIRDHAFAQRLRTHLKELREDTCQEISPDDTPRRTLGRQMLSYLVFQLVRRFPWWVGWLPAHTPVRQTYSGTEQTTTAAQPGQDKAA